MPYQSGEKRGANMLMGLGRLRGRSRRPRLPERLLDALPGLIAWAVLIFCVVGVVLFPYTLLTLASLLVAYSALRFVIAGLANLRGLRRIRQAERTDWHARYVADAGPGALPWEAVQHVVIIPNYQEPIEVLARSLEHIAASPLAQEQITIVLAMEAAETDAIRKAETLQAAFELRFRHFHFTVHPSGLPGEMQCKSANQAWAARWIRRKLVDQLGYDINHIVVTTMDADTLWNPAYFAALLYHFAVDTGRYNRFWQAPIRYHANVFAVHPLLRLVNAYSTAIELAYLAADWWLTLPMSSYSLSLRLLDTVDYWDPDVIADEWHMYIKTYFDQDGELALTPIYLPFLATAVTGPTFWRAAINRYQQSLRHAWGSKEIGYTVARMLDRPTAGWWRSLRLLMRVAHDILHSGAGWIMVTLGTQLPLWLNPDLLERLLSDPFGVRPFVILNLSFAVILLLGVVFWALDVRVRPPRRQRAAPAEALLVAFGFLLLPMLTLLFVSLPVLHAQTRLLIGMPLAYRVTPKL